MAFNFNGNVPKNIIYNTFNVAKLVYNNVVVWLQRILYTVTGIPPLTASKSFGEPLEDYKIYGNSEQGDLPQEYTEVEYISSDQIIDLGIKTNNNIVVETKANALMNSVYIYASDSGSSLTTNTTLYVSDASGYWRFGNQYKSLAFSLDTFHETKQNKDGCWIDGVKKQSYSSVNDFTSSNNLKVFVSKTPNSVQIAYIKTKNYGENSYTHIWIPCKRNSDNVYGLYDIIGKQFYTNTEANIEAGSEVVPTPTSANPIEIKSVGDLILENRLPSEYQEVEYLESTGKQYIDTGFAPNQDTKIEIDFQFVDYTYQQTYGFLYGGRSAINKNAFSGGGLTLTNEHFRFNYASVGNIYSNVPQDNNRHTIIQDKNNIYIDEVLNVTTTYTTFVSSNNLYLFSTNNNNYSSSYAVKAKIFKCKIWDNGTLIRHYIPCYRKSDDKPGMYDVVTNTFYTNAGTGADFTVGSSYKIPILVNAGQTTTTTNIYLDEPLRKVGNYSDYIDYANSKRVTNVEVIDNTGTLPIEQSLRGLAAPIEETIELPEILTQEGTNIISVGTEVQPSNMEVQYYGTKF